jgi:hypothetical protein
MHCFTLTIVLYCFILSSLFVSICKFDKATQQSLFTFIFLDKNLYLLNQVKNLEFWFKHISNRDVNLYMLVEIPAGIAPFGAPEMEIFLPWRWDGGKNSPAETSGKKHLFPQIFVDTVGTGTDRDKSPWRGSRTRKRNILDAGSEETSSVYILRPVDIPNPKWIYIWISSETNLYLPILSISNKWG